MASWIEEGPIRKKLRELLQNRPHLLKSPQLLEYYHIDSEIESMKEAKRREWQAKGYPESLIEKGFRLADDWVISMARAFLPKKPELQKELIRASYEKALAVADRWLKAMTE